MTASADLALPALDELLALDPGQAATFAEKGHTVVRGLASGDEVASYRRVIGEAVQRLNTETRPLEERDTYGKAFLQIHNLWAKDDASARFTLARRFAGVAADLLGVDSLRLYHDQALYKEPGGGATPWHQDQYYWPLDTDRTITMWMPLVDVPAEVGSMHFVNGSHRLGYLGKFAIGDESEQYFQDMIAERGLDVETHGACAAGDATFHAGWVLHSAPGNPSTTMREVMTVIYVADGARVGPVDSQDRRNDLEWWIPGRGQGDPVDTHLNPVVFSR